jgi:hypothetical protein
MLVFLKVAYRDPGGHLVECADGADAAKDESHETADQVAILPASGLKSGPKVAVQTSFASLAVIEEKAVGAGHSIVVKVVYDRNVEIKSGLIDRRGKARKDVVNDPKVKTIFLLQVPKIFGDLAVVKGANRKHELTAERPTEKLLRRALIISYIVKRE